MGFVVDIGKTKRVFRKSLIYIDPKFQAEYNLKNNIIPVSTKREIGKLDEGFSREKEIIIRSDFKSAAHIEKEITSLKGKMRIKAQKLDFEEAAKIRDEISLLRKKLLTIETGEFYYSYFLFFSTIDKLFF